MKKWKRTAEILTRPNPDDKQDTDRLKQTALEQTAANRDFRELADFFQSFRYLHMVPQLVRHAPEFQGRILPDDPFGQNLMNSIAKLSKKKQQSQLHRIGEALHNIMPQIDPVLEFERDKGSGKPHLQVRHKNWRPRSASAERGAVVGRRVAPHWPHLGPAGGTGCHYAGGAGNFVQ